MANETPALGSRENYFAHQGDDLYQENEERNLKTVKRGNAKVEHIADTLLRADSSRYCPECSEKLDKTVEVSEPELFVRRLVMGPDGEPRESGPRRFRSRYCPNCGVVTGGYIRDRPARQLKELVEEIIAAVDASVTQRSDILSNAMRLKKEGETKDRVIVEEVVRDIRFGVDRDDR